MSHRDLQRFTRYGLRLSDRFSHSGTWAPSPYPYRFGSVPLPINVSAVDLAVSATGGPTTSCVRSRPALSSAGSGGAGSPTAAAESSDPGCCSLCIKPGLTTYGGMALLPIDEIDNSPRELPNDLLYCLSGRALSPPSRHGAIPYRQHVATGW
jgi:hypothetical protein